MARPSPTNRQFGRDPSVGIWSDGRAPVHINEMAIDGELERAMCLPVGVTAWAFIPFGKIAGRSRAAPCLGGRGKLEDGKLVRPKSYIRRNGLIIVLERSGDSGCELHFHSIANDKSKRLIAQDNVGRIGVPHLHEALAFYRGRRRGQIQACPAEAFGNRDDQREKIATGGLASVNRGGRGIGIDVINYSGGKAPEVTRLSQEVSAQARIAFGERSEIRRDDLRDAIGAEFRAGAIRGIGGHLVDIVFRPAAIREGCGYHVVGRVCLQGEEMLDAFIVCSCRESLRE